MAIVTFDGQFGIFFRDLFEDIVDAPVLSHSATAVTFDLLSGDTLTLRGSFTAFDANGRPTAGTITGADAVEGVNSGSLSNVSMSVGDFFGYIASDDSEGLLSDLFSGNDTYVSDVRGAYMFGGDGNDRFILREPLYALSNRWEGGDGFDVVEVRPSAAQPGTDGNSYALVWLADTSGIERLYMNSQSGGSLHAVINLGQMGQFSSLQGGAGDDLVSVLLPPGGGSFHLEAFNLINWGPNDSYGIAVGQWSGNYRLTTDSHTGTIYLNGGSGNDVLIGTNGAEALLGQAGNDMLIGHGGNDTLGGGDGIDTVHYASATGAVTVNLGLTGPQNTRGAGIDTILNVERVFGSAHGDLLIGNADANLLDGRGGGDVMRGMEGNDTYYVNAGGDRVQEALDAGTDLVRSSISYTLAANVENLVLLGSGNLFGNGNGQDNVIHGNGGSNTLDGRAGDDTLKGNGGSDTLIGGFGKDYLYCGGDSAVDTIVVRSTAESKVGATRDVIFNFVSGIDDIDLRLVDASSTLAGDQLFAFSNSGPAANSIWVVDIGSHLLVRGDVNGNFAPDFELQLNNTSTAVATDFLL